MENNAKCVLLQTTTNVKVKNKDQRGPSCPVCPEYLIQYKNDH